MNLLFRVLVIISHTNGQGNYRVAPILNDCREQP